MFTSRHFCLLFLSTLVITSCGKGGKNNPQSINKVNIPQCSNNPMLAGDQDKNSVVKFGVLPSGTYLFSSAVIVVNVLNFGHVGTVQMSENAYTSFDDKASISSILCKTGMDGDSYFKINELVPYEMHIGNHNRGEASWFSGRNIVIQKSGDNFDYNPSEAILYKGEPFSIEAEFHHVGPNEYEYRYGLLGDGYGALDADADGRDVYGYIDIRFRVADK